MIMTKDQLKKRYVVALMIIGQMEDLEPDAVDITIKELLEVGELEVEEVTLSGHSDLIH